MIRNSFCVFIVIFYFINITIAQIDSFYIQPTSNNKTFALHSTLRNVKLAFSSSVADELVLQKNDLGFGFRMKYKKIGVSLSIPVVAFHKSDFGKPKAFGFSFNLFPNKYFIQGTFQYIKGFDDLRSVEDSKVFRPNSNMVFTSLTGNYIFNHRRFSLRSAFKMVNIQKRSAGSWLISVPLNYQYFSADSISLPLMNQADFQFDLYQSFKVGLGGGYAYTKVLGDWSITGLLSGGAEFRNLKYRTISNDAPKNEFLISPRIRFVGSVVYNVPTFFIGLVGHYLPGIEIADGLNTRVENFRLRAVVGKRF